MKFAVIGDIHGHFKEMQQMIQILEEKHNPEMIVFVGDYVDRGPNSRHVIDFIRKNINNPKYVFLKGNHEDMMICAAKGYTDPAMWLANGGQQTFSEYARDGDLSLVPKNERDKRFAVMAQDADLLDRLPTHLVLENHVVVHGGIPQFLNEPDADLTSVRARDQLLWYRDTQFRWNGKRVVHGHTPVKRVYITDDEINVDTGCGFGLNLSAAVIDDATGHVDVVMIPAKRK